VRATARLLEWDRSICSVQSDFVAKIHSDHVVAQFYNFSVPS